MTEKKDEKRAIRGSSIRFDEPSEDILKKFDIFLEVEDEAGKEDQADKDGE
ncbi:hypothetical protein ORM30_00585 [Bacillus cereus]|uniref:hypothetical protein n=1 Tax=Bacillus sp. RB3 TaxID=3050012 RepID=UPI002541FCCB|nr:hypothetical protein [Bacillus sp. RB3]MDK3011618.1 hypothetical protein [Bacillus sp. RB3]MDZ4439043.1 hypothetical protein [Bacillus cereus]